jgi:beta-glucosidase
MACTTFQTTGLSLKGLTATFTVKNTGTRDGDEVAQLYLTTAMVK